MPLSCGKGTCNMYLLLTYLLLNTITVTHKSLGVIKLTICTTCDNKIDPLIIITNGLKHTYKKHLILTPLYVESGHYQLVVIILHEWI